MKIYEIKDRMVGEWNAEGKAIIDTVENYFHLTLADFKETVFNKGIKFAKANGGIAWIVDNTNAKGVFSQDIQTFLKDEGFKMFKENGIEYFITINSNANPLTNMTAGRYKVTAGKSGLQQVELHSVSDAIMWLKTNAK